MFPGQSHTISFLFVCIYLFIYLFIFICSEFCHTVPYNSILSAPVGFQKPIKLAAMENLCYTYQVNTVSPGLPTQTHTHTHTHKTP